MGGKTCTGSKWETAPGSAQDIYTQHFRQLKLLVTFSNQFHNN